MVGAFLAITHILTSRILRTDTSVSREPHEAAMLLACLILGVELQTSYGVLPVY